MHTDATNQPYNHTHQRLVSFTSYVYSILLVQHAYSQIQSIVTIQAKHSITTMGVNEDILSCFARRPYTLVDFIWLPYDEEGSRLFERITQQDEYYLSRTERRILEANADKIIAQAQGDHNYRLRIIELGAGTANRTDILLSAAIKRQGSPIHYLPVDVSPSALAVAKSTLEHLVPGVCVTPQIANYMTEQLTLPNFAGRTLVAYIGSSIGNVSRTQAATILEHVRRQMQPGDAMLLGVDMYKDPAIILPAYDVAQGMSAGLNLSSLRRLNCEFGYNFKLDQFRHRAVWNKLESRIELYLESLCSQRVQCAHSFKQNIDFDKGDTIHTANSYKYTPEHLKTLLTNAGFELENTWSDEQKWFTVVLARVPASVT